LCCSQNRLGFFNSAEYDVFSFKSTTWWFLAIFKFVTIFRLPTLVSDSRLYGAYFFTMLCTLPETKMVFSVGYYYLIFWICARENIKRVVAKIAFYFIIIYDVFSFKSTTWWFLAIFKFVWYSVHSEHNSSSHSIHQLTDVLTIKNIIFSTVEKA
jgi:hypothetical protein